MIGVKKMYPCAHNEDLYGAQEFMTIGVNKKGKLVLIHTERDSTEEVTVKLPIKKAVEFRNQLRKAVNEKDDRHFELEHKKYYVSVERADCTGKEIHIVILLEVDKDEVVTVHLAQANAESFLAAVEQIIEHGTLEFQPVNR